MGAVVWKNLVAARRSRRQLLVGFILTALYAGALTALLWNVHGSQHAVAPGQATSSDLVMRRFTFHLGLAFWIAILAPFLQRIFPFDFRRDGQHLLDFRTLPMSPLWLVLAEVAVPVGFVLLCQAAALSPCSIYARFDWPSASAAALCLPGHRPCPQPGVESPLPPLGDRRAGGHAQSPSAVGTLMVVVLSFLVFVPALWTMRFIARASARRLAWCSAGDGFLGLGTAEAWLRFCRPASRSAGAGALGVQYLVELPPAAGAGPPVPAR